MGTNNNLGCIIFFFSSNRKRFPKLPGFVGYVSQFLAIVSLLLPKCYLQTLIVLNDGNTLAFGVLLALEFGVILLCNRIFYGEFGGMYDLNKIFFRTFFNLSFYIPIISSNWYFNCSNFFEL